MDWMMHSLCDGLMVGAIAGRCYTTQVITWGRVVAAFAIAKRQL